VALNTNKQTNKANKQRQQIGTFYGLVFGLILWGLRHFQQYFSFYWRSVLLVEETGRSGENHRPAASY
jgi:hypothetical protein